MKKESKGYRDAGKEPEQEQDGQEKFSLRNLRTFSSLGNPVYRLYYGALLFSWASLNMQMMARSLLIYRLTGSAAILGALSLGFAIPMLFLSLFGGAIADRFQKKYILVAAQASSALTSLGVALSLTLGYLSTENPGSWWILGGASVLQGIVLGFSMPARYAIIREIVTEEQVMNATALNSLGMNTFRLLAPAATGFIIDAFDFAAAYYVVTGMYLLAAVFVALMPVTGTITVRVSSTMSDIREGLRYVRRDAIILFLLLFNVFSVMLSYPYMSLMPIITESILGVGATSLGILISVSGLGAVFGSIVLASLPNKKRGAMLLISGLILGLALIGFSFSLSWSLSLAMIVLVGLGSAWRMTLSSSLLQYYAEADYRGRVMSIYSMEVGLIGFGTFAAGLIAEVAGVQWALGSFAMVLAFLSILMFALVPRIRKLD